jgi:hypothetical protein
MSAALQLQAVWGAGSPQNEWFAVDCGRHSARQTKVRPELDSGEPEHLPDTSLAFYRKHTEKLLRRYLYASMQVGRTPSILGEPIARGMVSSRTVRTFEDAVIFVLDIESCIEKLGSLDKAVLSKVVLQDYTQAEAAVLLGMNPRSLAYRLPRALDRLTEKLLEAGLLVFSQS